MVVGRCDATDTNARVLLFLECLVVLVENWILNVREVRATIRTIGVNRLAAVAMKSGKIADLGSTRLQVLKSCRSACASSTCATSSPSQNRASWFFDLITAASGL